MDKYDRYKQLCSKRKKYSFVDSINSSVFMNGQYDCDEIGTLSVWQGNLDADILCILRDWGCTKTFKDQKGKDIYNSTTNKNLHELFKSIGIEIGTPSKPSNSNVFLTNAVLGLHEGDTDSGYTVSKAAIKECSKEFLKPLIEDIIKPKVILTLGADAFYAVNYLYDIKNKYGLKDICCMSELINHDEFNINGINIIPLYHSAARPTNRTMIQQKKDWERVIKYLK